MKEKANEVVGEEKNILAQTRLLYDHVTSFMNYDATKQSWKGSTGKPKKNLK